MRLFRTDPRLRRRTNPNPDAAWLASHPGRACISDPRLKPVRELLLRVDTGFYTAGALWRKVFGVWSCTKAAPILHWMVGQTPSEVHLELLKLGAEFEWIKDPADSRHCSFLSAESASVTNEATVRPTSASSGSQDGVSRQESSPLPPAPRTLPAPHRPVACGT